MINVGDVVGDVVRERHLWIHSWLLTYSPRDSTIYHCQGGHGIAMVRWHTDCKTGNDPPINI